MTYETTEADQVKAISCDRVWCSIPAGGAIFIGGYDMFNEDIHRWLDGTPCMPGGGQYTNWFSGSPYNGDKNYMRIRMDLNGKWGDWSGETNRKYLCESGLI